MARDSIHFAVRRALEKDGWTITNDPFYVDSGGVMIEIDLAAEFILAEKESIKLLIEVKSLNGNSLIYDFHATVGQYLDYKAILRDEKIDRQLYLAISKVSYEQMLLKPFNEKRLIEFDIHLIIVDIVNETILQWKKQIGTNK
jgi:XisH protein